MQKLMSTEDAELMAKTYRFLSQRGVPVTVSEHGSQLELWLTVASYSAHAKALLQELKHHPELLDQAEPAHTPASASSHATPSLLKQLLQQSGWFTAGYALLVVLVFAGLQVDALQEPILYALLYNPDSFEQLPWAQPWRLLTPALLHFSAMHILFNVFWWWYLGGRFERYYGSKWLILTYVCVALVSNTAQFMVSGPYFGGLSGVVYGLFGLAVVVAWNRPRHPLFLPRGLIIFMLAWLLLGYTDLLWVNVANTAHTAGLVSGLLVGALIQWLSRFSTK